MVGVVELLLTLCNQREPSHDPSFSGFKYEATSHFLLALSLSSFEYLPGYAWEQNVCQFRLSKLFIANEYATDQRSATWW